MISQQKIFLLSQREWMENKRSYLIGVLALAAIFILLFTITWHFRNSFSGDTERGIFLLGLFGGGSLFAASFMRDLRSPAKAVWQLCLPASVAEKVVVAVLFTVAGYVLVFLAVFYSVEYVFRALVSAQADAGNLLDLGKNSFYSFIYFFINVQLLMLIGSTIFRKAAFLKTLLLLILLFFLSGLANNVLLELLTAEKQINGGALFDYFQFYHGGENVYVHLPDNIDQAVSGFFHFILPALLGCIMYYKLKELECR